MHQKLQFPMRTPILAQLPAKGVGKAAHTHKLKGRSCMEERPKPEERKGIENNRDSRQVL